MSYTIDVYLHVFRFVEERAVVAPLGPRGKAVLTAVFVLVIATCYGPTNAFIYFQF